jgi:hypothetical protein
MTKELKAKYDSELTQVDNLVNELLKKVHARFEYDESKINWGHYGDLKHLEELLVEANDFMS